jgi:hypothetical protein
MSLTRPPYCDIVVAMMVRGLPKLAAFVALGLFLAVSIAGWVGVTVRDRVTEAAAYRAVYVAASLSRGDPDAAVRKAHWTTDIMVKDFGMTRGEAAADVARFLILHGAGLCRGGQGATATRSIGAWATVTAGL